MSGHLFVVHGDLSGRCMNAILVPSGSGVDEAGSVRAGHVTSAWVGELGAAVQDGFLDDAPDASRPVVRAIDSDGIRRPAVWAGFSGDQGDEPLAFNTRVVERSSRRRGSRTRRRRGGTTPADVETAAGRDAADRVGGGWPT